jgi:hypothetical protein
VLERKLWEIPLSETGFADRVPDLVESGDTGELARFYRDFFEHVKAESRKRR